MTRAIISVFKGDFYGYVKKNAMAIPVLVAVLLLVHVKKFKRKKTVLIIGSFILVVNLVYYAVRLYLNII